MTKIIKSEDELIQQSIDDTIFNIEYHTEKLKKSKLVLEKLTGKEY